MADKKSNDKTDSKKGSGSSSVEYVGPNYVRGMLMPDGRVIRPKEATAKQRKEMIAKYPRVESYFKNL